MYATKHHRCGLLNFYDMQNGGSITTLRISRNLRIGLTSDDQTLLTDKQLGYVNNDVTVFKEYIN